MEKNEVYKVFNSLSKQMKYGDDGYAIIPTEKGRLRIHKNHGRTEKKLNIMIAKFLVENFGYDIDFLPNEGAMGGRKNSGIISADSFNHTLKRHEEYKYIYNPTNNAVEMALKAGHKQAAHIILWINNPINNKNLRRVVRKRLNRHENLKEVRVICAGNSDIVISKG